MAEKYSLLPGDFKTIEYAKVGNDNAAGIEVPSGKILLIVFKNYEGGIMVDSRGPHPTVLVSDYDMSDGSIEFDFSKPKEV